MPIFEYKCIKCGTMTEFLEKSSGRSSRSCPKCGSKELEKQISVFSPAVKQGESKRCHGCSDFTCPHSGR